MTPTLSRAEPIALPIATAPPRPNLLVLWHLLSLDAPTVAAVWTIFVARVLHVSLVPAIPIAMFLAVWAIYAADRLLDTHQLTAQSNFEPRHHFHHRHRRAFTAAILATILALIPFTLEIPPKILHRYLILAALLLLWFLLIHSVAKPLPKELVLGPFFAAAVFLPVWTQAWSPHILPAAMLFALLCSLNCLYIYAWEHPSRDSAHPATRAALRLLTPLTLVVIAFPITPILVAIALAAALLFLLNRLRNRFDPTTLRAAADLILLTPVLIAPFLK